MNAYLKLISGIVGLATISPALLAADATTYGTYATYATNTYALPTYSASNLIATSSSNAVVLALNAQTLLLSELVQEHQKRAAELTQKNQTGQARWESDLVNELQEKCARVQKSIDQAPSWTGTNASKARSGEADDELTAAPDSFAFRDDGAAVQLDETPHECQSDP